MPRLPRRSSICLLGLLMLFQGCQMYNAGADFVHQRYVNTVAYFNTYYNAKKAFEDGEKQVLDQQKSAAGKQSAQAAALPLPGDSKAKFNLAIEKASKLLTFYPTSKWVDDALFMIGKSYFYLGDDLHSERKFLELFAKYPDSDLLLEAELWYGRSLLRQKRYDEGIQSLDQLYTKAAGLHEKAIAGAASAELGNHYYISNNYDRAIEYYQRSVEISNDDRMNAETELQIGYCYRQKGDLQKAEQAFGTVGDFSPDYATSFTAKFERITVLVRLQQYTEAMEKLTDLAGDAKNVEYFSKIQYEIGRLYEAQNKFDEAIKKYSYVDTAFAKTEDAAQAYYRLGKIYELNRENYQKAAGYYDKSRNESVTAPTNAEAGRKADAFVKYFSLRSDLHRYDSIIVAIKGRPAKRDYLRLTADSIRLAADSLRMGNVDSLARVDSARAQLEKRLLAQESESVDSLRHLIVKARFELAGIFYLEIDRQDSALYWFQRVIDEEGKSEFAERSLFTLAEIARTSGATDKKIVDSLYGVVIAQYPESPYAQESRRILGIHLLEKKLDPAEALYHQAEEYMDGEHSDSALPFLYKIVREGDPSPFSPKALYAIGWIYENKLEEEDSASAVYRRLIAGYPKSEFAVAVRPKIQEEDAAKQEAEQKAKLERDAKKKKEEEEKKAQTPAADSTRNEGMKKEKP